MSTQPRKTTALPNRSALLKAGKQPKRQPYIFGALGGLLTGLAGAYLFARAAQSADDDPATPERPPLDNGQIFALVLALVALVRQIVEMGNPPQKKK
ncbi:MAG: hypothetical protein MUF38_06785 [Anaerolineae bacterium]|jgi:hypothetical protein|nr:hypothetical protein [Anaerolineae bacterium]